MKLFGTMAVAVSALAISAAAYAKPIQFVNATKVACAIQGPGLELTLDPNASKTVEYTHRSGTVTATCKGGGYSNANEQSVCLKPADNIEFSEVRMRPWQFGAFVCAPN